MSLTLRLNSPCVSPNPMDEVDKVDMVDKVEKDMSQRVQRTKSSRPEGLKVCLFGGQRV